LYNEWYEKAKSDYTYRRINFGMSKVDGGEISGEAQMFESDKVKEIVRNKSTMRKSDVGA
jgi:hypothetical protein